MTLNEGGFFKGKCGRCAMRYIFSSFVVDGITVERISRTAGKNFVSQLKGKLSSEIKQYEHRGLKSIKITGLTTYRQDNLVIDFVSVVKPKYHEKIRNAIRNALFSFDVSFVSFFFFIYRQ